MNFGDAIHHLKNGHRVTRKGWNGRGMYLYHEPGFEFAVKRNHPLNQEHPEGTMVAMNPFIVMRTADGTVVPWLASQTDVLSTDWEVVDNGRFRATGNIGDRLPVLGEG